jgi:hypothetical protein
MYTLSAMKKYFDFTKNKIRVSKNVNPIRYDAVDISSGIANQYVIRISEKGIGSAFNKLK